MRGFGSQSHVLRDKRDTQRKNELFTIIIITEVIMLRTVTTQVRSSIKGRCSGTLRFNSIFRKRWLSTDASKPKIEVEVKFPFSKAEEDKIQAVSKLISIKRFTDHYFDNNAYALTSKDIWLRLRDGRWECKTSTLDFKRASNPNHKDVSLLFHCTPHYGYLLI